MEANELDASEHNHNKADEHLGKINGGSLIDLQAARAPRGRGRRRHRYSYARKKTVNIHWPLGQWGWLCGWCGCVGWCVGWCRRFYRGWCGLEL